MSELSLLLRLDNIEQLPDGGPVRYEVNRRGLDIGRDAYLDWTLPDPERFISGKHCEIRYRDGGYWLHDVSTNGTSVNGRGGRLTEPHRLQDGDRIHIGHYIVAVEVQEDAQAAQSSKGSAAAAGESDPWGGLGDTAAAVDRRDFAAHARAEAGQPEPRGPADLAEEEISWGVGRVTESAPPSDGDIWGAPPPTGGGAANASSDDWGWTPPAPKSAGGPRSDAVGPDWRAELARQTPAPEPAVQPREERPAPRRPAPDPAPEPPAAERPATPSAPPPATEAPPAQPPTVADNPAAPEAPAPRAERPAPHADPFADLADSAAPAPAAPSETPAAPPASPEPAPESGRPAPQADPFGDLAEAAADPAPTASSSAPVATPPASPTEPDPASRRPHPAAAPPPAAPEAAPAAPAPSGLASRWADGAETPQSRPVSRPPAGQGGDFIAAFERGAGLPAGAVADRADAAFAEELGALMKVVTQNLQAMLAARAETKSAMRSADRTMIGALENNPLKFSPTPEDALRIMFGAKSRSYLDATKTVDSSFRDLQKHQLQTFAAMQQALQALIEDLDPKSIEEATSKDGGLAGIVGSRRARFWDTYVERFRAKSGRHERGMIDAFMILFAEMYDRQR